MQGSCGRRSRAGHDMAKEEVRNWMNAPDRSTGVYLWYEDDPPHISTDG